MRRHSVEEKYAIFYRAAALSVQANTPGRGFRQRDFLFFLDLLLNWGLPANSPGLRLHNGQSRRFLQQLAEDGFARCERGRQPSYRLTRLGLLELVSQMVADAGKLDPHEFYFLFYFVSTYRSQIEQLIAAEGRQFPSALRLEILGLLDAEELLRVELRRTDQALEKLDLRVRETQAGARLYEEQRRLGRSVNEAAEQLERRYPYQLNSQKPLSKLISEIPEEIAEAELTTSARRRVELMFQPAKQLLLRHRENLRQMLR